MSFYFLTFFSSLSLCHPRLRVQLSTHCLAHRHLCIPDQTWNAVDCLSLWSHNNCFMSRWKEEIYGEVTGCLRVLLDHLHWDYYFPDQEEILLNMEEEKIAYFQSSLSAQCTLSLVTNHCVQSSSFPGLGKVFATHRGELPSSTGEHVKLETPSSFWLPCPLSLHPLSIWTKSVFLLGKTHSVLLDFSTAYKFWTNWWVVLKLD